MTLKGQLLSQDLQILSLNKSQSSDLLVSDSNKPQSQNKTPINRKSTGKTKGPDEPPYLKSLSKPEFSQPGTFKYSVPRKEQATFCGGEQGIEFGQLLLHLASIPSDVHSEDLWNHSQVASPVAKTLLPSPWIKAVTSPTRSPGP